MANLNGQNIGTNYKGFLNLDSTINTPLDATLRAVTDGMGTSSPFSISTAQAAIGTYTAASYASAKLIVGNYASANSEVANIGVMAVSQATLNSATAYGYAVYGHGYTNGSARSAGLVGEGKVTATGDTGSAIGVRGYANDTHAGGFNIGLYGDATGGSSNYALYMAAGDIYSAVAQTWSFASGQLTIKAPTASTRNIVLTNSSTDVTGIQFQRQDGSIIGDIYNTGGGFFVGNNFGKSLFFSNNGTCGLNSSGTTSTLLTIKGTGTTSATTSLLVQNSSSVISLQITDNNLLCLGGTTSSFPAIKRNGAAIDFRLADDSGYAAITSTRLIVSGDAGSGTTADVQSLNNNLSLKAGYYFRLIATSDSNSIVLGSAFDGSLTYTFAERRFVVGSISINSSAVLQADSTTKGFLPPRQTQAQRTAIASPAVGLMVYQTDTVEGLYIYKSTGWTFIA